MRQMWPWRDWVISAFNRNLPFDRFITWQLAGDLLPEPTEEQRLATGFNRNHMQTPGGRRRPRRVPHRVRRRSREHVRPRVSRPERRVRAVPRPQVRPDHAEGVLPALQLLQQHTTRQDRFRIPACRARRSCSRTTPSRATLDALRADARRLEEEIRALASRRRLRRAGWRRAATRPTASIAEHPGTHHLSAARRQHDRARDDEAQARVEGAAEARRIPRLANLAPGAKERRLGGDKDRVPKTVPGHIGQAQQLVGDSHIEVADKRTLFRAQRSVRPQPLGAHRSQGRVRTARHESGGLFNGNRGYEIILRGDGTFSAALHHVFPDNSIEIETTRPLDPGRWHHLALTYDGSSRARGLRLFFDGSSPTRASSSTICSRASCGAATRRTSTGATTRLCGLAVVTTRRCRTSRSTSSASMTGG